MICTGNSPVYNFDDTHSPLGVVSMPNENGGYNGSYGITKIYVIKKNWTKSHIEPPMLTSIVASKYDSWYSFATAISTIWMKHKQVEFELTKLACLFDRPDPYANPFDRPDQYAHSFHRDQPVNYPYAQKPRLIHGVHSDNPFARSFDGAGILDDFLSPIPREDDPFYKDFYHHQVRKSRRPQGIEADLGDEFEEIINPIKIAKFGWYDSESNTFHYFDCHVHPWETVKHLIQDVVVLSSFR